MTYRVPDSRTHSHASCSGCHLGHETRLPGRSSRRANSRWWSRCRRLSWGRWSRCSSHLRCPAGRRGHAGSAAPASTRHGYWQTTSTSRSPKFRRDRSGFRRAREWKTGRCICIILCHVTTCISPCFCHKMLQAHFMICPGISHFSKEPEFLVEERSISKPRSHCC